MGVDPISAAFFALQAVSAVKGHIAEKKAAKAQQRANAATLQAAQEEAELAKKDAEFAAIQERKEARRLRGQQIAAYLKSGVTLDGSPLLTTSETEEQGKRNAQNTIDNAESRARSILLRGQANQKPVQKPDIFGTAASIFGAGQTAFGKG
jgi:hypothetical protein